MKQRPFLLKLWHSLWLIPWDAELRIQETLLREKDRGAVPFWWVLGWSDMTPRATVCVLRWLVEEGVVWELSGAAGTVVYRIAPQRDA